MSVDYGKTEFETDFNEGVARKRAGMLCAWRKGAL